MQADEPASDILSAMNDAAGSATVRAVFELSACASSMALLECCAEVGISMYQWKPSVAMFKQLHPGGFGGPAWIAAGSAGAVSEDLEIEKRGWGYLSGDEDLVVDTATMSDVELATFLGTPSAKAEESTTLLPWTSSLGYALHPAQSPPPLPTALTDVARRVLVDGGTEPPGSHALADGILLPPEGARGLYCSPLSGAPIFSAAQRRRSTSGWPSFAAAADSDEADLAEHLGRRTDYHGGTSRVECFEPASGAHLGHDFDGDLCINAASLIFVRSGDAPPAWLPRPSAPAALSVVQSRPELVGRVRVATLAGGCFWGMRSGLARLPGVLCVLTGFTGGEAASPTYEHVCAGGTGHVEACQVAFDPAALSFRHLLDAYWRAVPEPTSAYRQGNDVGTQYEPCVFYHSEGQRDAAEESKQSLEAAIGEAVAARVLPAAEFWVAGDEHQQQFG